VTKSSAREGLMERGVVMILWDHDCYLRVCEDPYVFLEIKKNIRERIKESNRCDV
jgi:hypothetical protein